MRWGGFLLTLVAACAPHPQGTQAPPALHVGRADTLAAVAIVTAAAAGAYVAAGGCKIAGCPTHLACNPVNERCESIGCTPTGPACPPGSVCEERTGRCQTQPAPGYAGER